MKVAENESNRKVEVHLHVEGKMEPLKEYDEYIDPIDKATCCYVPVNEGHKIKIQSIFSGTVSFAPFIYT